MLAAGLYPDETPLTGNTMSDDGVVPWLHWHEAPITTRLGMENISVKVLYYVIW